MPYLRHRGTFTTHTPARLDAITAGLACCRATIQTIMCAKRSSTWRDTCVVSACTRGIVVSPRRLPQHPVCRITGDHSNQDLRSALKPIYSPFFTNHIWSWLLCPPVIGFLRKNWLGWVSCTLFPIQKQSQPTKKYFLWEKKKWPKCHFLTFFFLVGLALGWGVRRFHNKIYMFSYPERIWLG